MQICIPYGTDGDSRVHPLSRSSQRRGGRSFTVRALPEMPSTTADRNVVSECSQSRTTRERIRFRITSRIHVACPSQLCAQLATPILAANLHNSLHCRSNRSCHSTVRNSVSLGPHWLISTNYSVFKKVLAMNRIDHHRVTGVCIIFFCVGSLPDVVVARCPSSCAGRIVLSATRSRVCTNQPRVV